MGDSGSNWGANGTFGLFANGPLLAPKYLGSMGDFGSKPLGDAALGLFNNGPLLVPKDFGSTGDSGSKLVGDAASGLFDDGPVPIPGWNGRKAANVMPGFGVRHSVSESGSDAESKDDSNGE